jgi:ER-bound oxygenase mpaB/B'/Rubber oxygenase, catalytic domain
MELFVPEESIVRKIWSRGDTVLLIFAGASAEFALNKAVDWLYFTGRLPADPLGRLFSTVEYARQIIFSRTDAALASIDRITSIHRGVEQARTAASSAGSLRIPDAAYLDVLFLLIDYSIRSFELLERRLSRQEKGEIFVVFHRVGVRMGLKELPDNYEEWVIRRVRYLKDNLVRSDFTVDLYKKYRKNLGSFRYRLLLAAQVLLVPAPVRRLLLLRPFPLLWPVVQAYRLVRLLHLDGGIKAILLPRKYRPLASRLDIP